MMTFIYILHHSEKSARLTALIHGGCGVSEVGFKERLAIFF